MGCPVDMVAGFPSTRVPQNAQRRAGQQFSGQRRADKTTQTNATDTTVAGGASQQTFHRHLRPLIGCDAFDMRGFRKKVFVLFITRVKRELKRVHRNGCRYNERLKR